MKINDICILGGGTSGFSVASLLACYREKFKLDFTIKMVYSESIETIGVGESSIFDINQFFEYLGLEDKDWMPFCNATYKSSVRFENFYKNGRYFHYPFGKPRPVNHHYDMHDWFVGSASYPEAYTPERSSVFFNPSAIFAERNKLIDESPDFKFNIKDNTTYHFDSHLLGNYLKKYCKKKGVEIIHDTFYGVAPNEDGSIKSLVCTKDIYSADLFIDCSGFRSLLLGEIMKEDYIPFSDTLINNKALVGKIPYSNKEEELKCYTNCVALQNGWCWEIPLWDGISVGYVHTNKFATEEEIEKEFFDRYGKLDYKTVKFKTGRYKRGWVKNVVGVGLSYGFIEPLEATGIATTLENTFRLLECLSKRDMFYTQVDRDLFNHAISHTMDKYKSFLELHYLLSSRDDSKYWKHLTESVDYDSVGYRKFLDSTILNRRYNVDNPLDFSGIVYIVAGMNYSYFSKAFTQPTVDSGEAIKNHVDKLDCLCDNYPSSYEYLKENIYS